MDMTTLDAFFALISAGSTALIILFFVFWLMLVSVRAMRHGWTRRRDFPRARVIK
jgi:hypothetical protein